MSLIRLTLVCALALFAAGCGGSSNPAGPSGGSGNGGGGGGTSSNRTMTVTIDGAAFAPTFVTAARSNPGFEIVTVVGTDASGSTVGFSAPTQAGVFNVNGPVTARGQGTMTILSGTTATAYLAFLSQGSGSVTITSISATAVAGRVDLVMAPTTLTGASKIVSGTFNVAF
jgi:hypothetical protein